MKLFAYFLADLQRNGNEKETRGENLLESSESLPPSRYLRVETRESYSVLFVPLFSRSI